MKKIGNKMASGAVWMVSFKMVERSLGFISTLILARLLVPSDFGLIAIAMSIVSFLELLGDFSFDMVLISKPGAERHHYDTAWTFNVVVGVVSGLVLLAMAFPLSVFFKEPRLENVIYALSLASLLQGFQNIGVVEFRKEMHFRKEFQFMASKKLAGFLVTIPMAIITKSYWALVVGILALRVAGVALSYLVHPFRPRLSLTGKTDLLHFSKWLLINNIVSFFRLRSGDIVLGRLAGPYALGLFNIAFEIATLPATEMIAPINRAVFPGYAKLASDLSELRRHYLQVIGLIAIIALPAAVGLSLTAELFVPILLGPKWIEAIVLVQILALYGALLAMQSNSGVLFIALGKPRTMTLLGSIALSLLIPLLLFLSGRYGSIGAATAFLSTAILIASLNFHLVRRNLKIRVVEYIGIIWRPLLATVSMAVVVICLRWRLPSAVALEQQTIQLGILVVAGAATYVFSIWISWILSGKPDGAEKSVIEYLRPKLRHRLADTPAE